MADPVVDDGPVPLHLPSILHNPTNHALRQVEAHNAQQRERLLARRAQQRGIDRNATSGSSTRGKRVIRRSDNASFVGNPHIVQPRRGDYAPPIPLQARPIGASFPTGAIPRSLPIPPVEIPDRDPTSSSSINGTFNTSLKGVRNMLRKHGRRAEGFIAVVEKEMRQWRSAPSWTFIPPDDEGIEGEEGGGWRVIDPHLVPIAPTAAPASGGEGSRTTRRRLPAQHQVTIVPPIPRTGEMAAGVLELSRSPAHLTWHVADGFERLVVHLMARYYELISWSEDHPTLNEESVRLTHIIQPLLLRPRGPSPHTLLSPETTDLSGQSSSDLDSVPSSESESLTDTDGDTETERGSVFGEEGIIVGDADEVEGYSLDPQSVDGDVTIRDMETPNFEDAMAELDLRQEPREGKYEHGAPLDRIPSSGSSMYASSEAGSDWSGLGDSLTLPPLPSGPDGWSSGLPHAALVSAEVNGHPVGARATGAIGRSGTVGVPRGVGKSGWDDKPSFMEYLYGA